MAKKHVPAPPPIQIDEALLFNPDAPPAQPSGGTPPLPPLFSGIDPPEKPGDKASRAAEPPTPPPPATPAELPHPRDRGPLGRLIDDNFLQFASYTICNRAIPTVEDGLKPVQRRILHALWEADDGRFTKVAGIVGDTMHYHPHGDASIYEAVVNLVNMRYLVEGQGNYGNLFTGDPAAAPRYIECRLTELARKEVFSPKITAFVPSYDGRNKEPVLLPAKLPLLLLQGAKGIAVGLSTEIFPHNFNELVEAQIAILQKKPFTLYPDFQTGAILDVSEYDDGRGKVKIRSTIEPRDKNKLVVTSLAWGQTTESLINSIEEAIRKKKVRVRDITDLTAQKVEIELVLAPGASQEKVTQELYAFTSCETSISSRPVVLYRNRPCEMSLSEILQANTGMLVDIFRRELEVRAGELDAAFHTKTLERIFIEERIYKRIEEQETYEAVQQAVLEGFVPFRPRLRRDVTPEDVEQLLQIRIRRISRYDIEKNRQEIEGILKEEAEVQDNLQHLRAYAIKYLKGLLKTYGKNYPRISRIADAPFAAIEVRELTASELAIKFDRENGYIGFDIRGGEELFKCSSLDKLLVLWNDGRWRMIPPPDKFFVDNNLELCRPYVRDVPFTCVYTEPSYGFTYIKRFAFGGAIQNKDYRIAPEKSRLLLFQEGAPEQIFVKYKPAKGQRIHQQVFLPSEVLVKGIKARGVQMTSKAIARIATDKPRWWDDAEGSPKGVLV
ncbi:MAG: DNA topoisomerase IV subunit A [Kiritimatiellia bacterium]|jgi:topoisomerase-4 subunit A